MNVNVSPSPVGFALSPSNSQLTILPGASATATISAVGPAGFSSAVNLVPLGLPSGIRATLSPNPTATGSSVLTLTVDASVLPGAYALFVNGSAPSFWDSGCPLWLTVPAPPDFSLATSDPAPVVAQGASTKATISVTPKGGFTSGVTLTASGLPRGVTASFGQNPATTTSLLTLTASEFICPGIYPVTISGVSGLLSSTLSFALVVPGAELPPVTPPRHHRP
jgi:hypothetical protein